MTWNLRRWYDRQMERWAGLRCPVCDEPKAREDRYCSAVCAEHDAMNQAIR